jgi:hypothetical protein
VANPKQKQAPEGANRRPGKSRFSIPQKEVPPIDGSYLERLFADYEKQSQELETGGTVAPIEENTATQTETPTSAAPQPVTTTSPESVQDTPPKALSVEPLPTEGVGEEVVASDESAEVQPSVPPTPEVAHPKGPPAQVEEIPTRRPLEFSGNDAILLEKLKKKHRLGKGEINVLRTMIGLCRDNRSDYCYIKIPQLMASSGLKERQTQLVLRSLRELELIEKLADYSNLDRLGTKYRVKFESFQV